MSGLQKYTENGPMVVPCLGEVIALSMGICESLWDLHNERCCAPGAGSLQCSAMTPSPLLRIKSCSR